jgi:nitrous oxidase accessory protein NosD
MSDEKIKINIMNSDRIEVLNDNSIQSLCSSQYGLKIYNDLTIKVIKNRASEMHLGFCLKCGKTFKRFHKCKL